MKYGVFDEKGLPQGFYDSKIHGSNIPTDAVEISDSVWLELIQNPGKRAYVGGTIIDISAKKWDSSTNQWVDKSTDEILNPLKEAKAAKLKAELQDFVYSHYDNGTQASFLSLYQLAKDKGRTDIITEIQKVWAWVNTVMNYYYNKKSSILNATSIDELNAITWDWSEVEETEHIELSTIMAMFNQEQQ